MRHDKPELRRRVTIDHVHSAWTSRRQFGQIAGELASTQDREFERAVLPYVHAIWPEARISPARQRLDQAGIDLYVGEPPRFDVVIQCKGFLERELLAGQVAQCRDSIAAFRDSHYSAREFYLLHNRHRHTPDYQREIEPLLAALDPAKAGKATLWNHRNLLVCAFDATLVRVRRAIAARTAALRREQELAERILGGDPLREVPVAVSEIRINASRLRSSTDPVLSVADPLHEILHGSRRKIGVLIGVAGFGKTTTAMRALREHSDHCVVLPAARIQGDIGNAHTLFEAALDPEDVLAEASDEDRPAWSRMVGPVLKYLTQSEKRDMVLIIDALDESPALEQSHGLHRFFNFLGRVKVPVVVTMRTEFWRGRRGDFDAQLGAEAERESTTQTLRIVELRPWQDEQIVAASEASLQLVTDAEARARVAHFIDMVKRAQYESLYGDIPRTPLFLKFILDVVQDVDAERMNRVALVQHWVRLKIARDVMAPARHGGSRTAIRAGIETIDDTVALATEAMRAAALAMCRRDAGRLELLPGCTFNAIRRTMGADAPDSPVALMLNSLLIPREDRQPDGSQSMRFAHRVFQEFFLAWALVLDPAAGEAELPDAVREWMVRFGHDA